MHVSHPLAGSRTLRRLSAVIATVLAAALAGPILSTASASASCDRSHFPTTCTVVEPTVTQNLTNYPQVQLFARQHVLIEAGGCVQTGGRGLTWKSYVDTAQRNSSYHGLIYIPGVTPGMVRLNSVVGTSVTIAQDTQLFLGYEDDGFSDNGYWAHDNGTFDQCKNVGNAWVRLTITG
jgi:hypothetical protein